MRIRRRRWTRVRLVTGTLRLLYYLCPIWLFGPILWMTRPVDNSAAEDGGMAPVAVALATVEPPGRVVLDTVSRDETLSDIFQRHDIDYRGLMGVLEASRDLFDLERIRSGSVVTLVFDGEKRFRRLEYPVDSQRLLLVDTLGADSVAARIDEMPYTVRRRTISGRIHSSLYRTIQELGEDVEVARMLADVFAWQIDFATELRPGDSFRAVVEEYRGMDGLSKVHAIPAAEFINAGTLHQAFRYEDTAGTTGYYDGEGASLRRVFLKSPLRYTRISSHFSRSRFHPILKRYRPHLGVDYAAPTGTPVLSVGDGEVLFAGREGGFGRIVKIRHNAVYRTTYGHLSRFARGIQKGARVRQGQVIGYVGATGLATGPHLDYRVVRNGRPVDPLSIDLPGADPVAPKEMVAFREVVLQFLDELDAEDLPELALGAAAKDSL